LFHLVIYFLQNLPAADAFDTQSITSHLTRDLGASLEGVIPSNSISQFVVKKNHDTDTKEKLMSMLPILLQTEVCAWLGCCFDADISRS
jgi:hypothetical protein